MRITFTGTSKRRIFVSESLNCPNTVCSWLIMVWFGVSAIRMENWDHKDKGPGFEVISFESVEVNEHPPFVGTLRYVSIRVHDRQEQGPSDDLVSLFYTLLELLRGDVPWRQLQHHGQIKTAKEQLKQDDFQQVSECFGYPVREFGRAAHAMRFDDEPNYAALQDIMKELSGQTPLNAKYDWASYRWRCAICLCFQEADYETVMNEDEINRHLKLIFWPCSPVGFCQMIQLFVRCVRSWSLLSKRVQDGWINCEKHELSASMMLFIFPSFFMSSLLHLHLILFDRFLCAGGGRLLKRDNDLQACF